MKLIKTFIHMDECSLYKVLHSRDEIVLHAKSDTELVLSLITNTLQAVMTTFGQTVGILLHAAKTNYPVPFNQSLKYPKFIKTKEQLEDYHRQLTEEAKGCSSGRPDEILDVPNHSLVLIVPTVNFLPIARKSFEELLRRAYSYDDIRQVGLWLPVGRHMMCLLLTGEDGSLWKLPKPTHKPKYDVQYDIDDVTRNLGRHVHWVTPSSGKGGIMAEMDLNPIQIMFNAYNLQYKLSREAILQAKNQTRGHHVYVHAPYTINLSHPYTKKSPDDDGWVINGTCNQLALSSEIGARGVVIHVGKHLQKMSPGAAVAAMYTNIKRVLQYATPECPLLLETPVGCGTEILWTFDDFANFYERFDYQDRQKLSICIDTCHVYASGTDPAEYVSDWIERFGSDSIGLIHFNDSKYPIGTRVDQHRYIGDGFIPLQSLAIVSHLARVNNIDMVLEMKER